MQGSLSRSVSKNQVCYLPFGWGRRIGIGQSFSL
uniref:Uncharacterized protein n=1 Tax=Brassica oleracea var. oleracea TaxID=109376 RepID=A0A0D3AZ62_BRAOL